MDDSRKWRTQQRMADTAMEMEKSISIYLNNCQYVMYDVILSYNNQNMN